MKIPTPHADEPVGALTRIADTLPPPARLVRRREATVRVTSEYSKASIDFLKKEARKAKVPYQRMLRALLDHYVAQQADA